MQEQERQERAGSCPAKRDRKAVSVGLERAEQPEVHDCLYHGAAAKDRRLAAVYLALTRRGHCRRTVPHGSGSEQEELDMKRRLTLGLALIAGALVAALASPLSRAEAPGKNGRIAYMVKDNKDHWQIWVANSDLTGPKRLTHGRYDSGWAVWSPDGKRLAFDSSRTDHTPNDSRHVNDVFVMNADGSGSRS